MRSARVSVVILVVLACLGGCGAKTGLLVPERDEEHDAGPTCIARIEVCNDADDDCDGAPDDGIACFTLDGSPIDALVTSTCGAAWYSYDAPDPESANPTPDIRISDGVVIALQYGPTCAGASLAVITDLPRDGSGGSLRGTFDVDPPRAGDILIADEPRECTRDADTGQVVCDWVWQPCCTDGVLVGPFTDACITLRTHAPIGVAAPVVLDGPRALSRDHDVPMTFCIQIRPAV